MYRATTNTAHVTAQHRLMAVVKLLRPRQWIKNGLVFAALLFSGRMLDWSSNLQSLLAFAGFCLASSGVYCLNDAIDAERDARHPKKRFRPVAAGVVSQTQAVILAVALSAAGLWLSLEVSRYVGLVVLSYQVINLLYSTWLKRVVIVDILAVASGFVLRAVGGALAIGVDSSQWFIVCVMLLSIFLAVGKRRNEVVTMDNSTEHRQVLDEYPLVLLDQLVAVLCGAVIVTYLLYALESTRPPLFSVTGLFVIYGIFRYLYLVYRKSEGGSPDELLISDLPLLATVALWGLTSAAIIYFY